MTEYRLTRRGALVALTAVAGGTAAGIALTGERAEESSPLAEADRQTLVALAETLYPARVGGIEAFVETYIEGRLAGADDRAAAVTAAIEALDEHAQAWYDRPFRDLSPAERDDALRGYGLDEADPDPDGTPVQRGRHHLFDELLLALYASPTGGELVGLENPPGHPGGTASYREGPPPD